MITVYEKKTGKPLKCEPVDATELVDSGFYVKEDPNAEKADESKPLNKKEIMKLLKSLEIDFDKTADTEDLRALIPEQE